MPVSRRFSFNITLTTRSKFNDYSRIHQCQLDDICKVGNVLKYHLLIMR